MEHAQGLPEFIIPAWNIGANVTSWFDWGALGAIGTVGALLLLIRGQVQQSQDRTAERLAVHDELIRTATAGMRSICMAWHSGFRTQRLRRAAFMKLHRERYISRELERVNDLSSYCLGTGLEIYQRSLASLLSEIDLRLSVTTPTSSQEPTLDMLRNQLASTINDMKKVRWRAAERSKPPHKRSAFKYLWADKYIDNISLAFYADVCDIEKTFPRQPTRRTNKSTPPASVPGSQVSSKPKSSPRRQRVTKSE